MADIRLAAKKREMSGRKVKRLREKGILPANMFGKKIDSQAIQIDAIDFKKVLSAAGETTIIHLDIEGDVSPVLITDMQLDPVMGVPIHVDFLHVDLKEKVTAQVPVELVGEAPAEKQGLGTVVHYIDELEVEALPTDLPEKFEINIENLEEVDQSIFVKDVAVDTDKVQIQNDPEQIITKVEPLREEEEELIVTEEVEVVEGEVEEEREGEQTAEEEGEAAEQESEE